MPELSAQIAPIQRAPLREAAKVLKNCFGRYFGLMILFKVHTKLNHYLISNICHEKVHLK